MGTRLRECGSEAVGLGIFTAKIFSANTLKTKVLPLLQHEAEEQERLIKVIYSYLKLYPHIFFHSLLLFVSIWRGEYMPASIGLFDYTSRMPGMV